MSDYKKHLNRQLENPEFAAEWERQRPEREYIKAIIAVRLEQNNPNSNHPIAITRQIRFK